MKNPNRGASKDLLQRYKEASYERMRVELKCSVELLMRDFDMTWDDLGRLLGMSFAPSRGMSRADKIKWKVVDGRMTLSDLNTLAHLFSCEPYIIFRPRLPWIKS
ncbi:hypothetical protein LCGC14_0959150 [marine sediment metagenome]|uniref:HTH cro/C1-type domain-containing protein n=1 Tax=marine sediment metagenome TaxID=412755 RepID=A0A0F9RLF8_9ZZZZ